MFYFAILIFTFGLAESSPVVDGADAEENEFPYIVSLRDQDNDHFCGGGIIAEDYILSAYHCLEGAHFKNITVVAGTNSQTKKDAEYTFKAERVYRFNNKKWLRASGGTHDDRHDLMILKLNGKIPLSSKARIARLPVNDLTNGTEITCAGWGLTKKEIDPDVLQKVTTVIQPLERCEEAIAGNDIGFFPPYELCTFAGKGKGLCSGDSGSPLVKDGVLVGVVLWVVNECGTGLPDYIANVFYYTDFIQSHLEEYDRIYNAPQPSEYIEIGDFFNRCE